jgi:hypothetical protein
MSKQSNTLDKKSRRQLDTIKAEALSSSDMINKTRVDNIVNYEDLKYVDNLLPLFKDDALIIIYLQTESFGHWCCLNILPDNNIEFFDPYGFFPDAELEFSRESDNQVKGEKLLTKLLAKLSSKYKVSYNHHKFQKQAPAVNTCGKHCILRSNLNNLSLAQYKKQLDDWLKRMPALKDYDDLVSLLTLD